MNQTNYCLTQNSCPIYRFCQSNLRTHGFETHRDVLLGSGGLPSHHYKEVVIEGCLGECGSREGLGDLCSEKPFVKIGKGDGRVISAENTKELTKKIAEEQKIIEESLK